MEDVKFKISKRDYQRVRKIVERFHIGLTQAGAADSFDSVACEMDLVACHANGCRLKFAELLEADDFNFVHDMSGISRHINRETGKLENRFLPRFAAK